MKKTLVGCSLLLLGSVSFAQSHDKWCAEHHATKQRLQENPDLIELYERTSQELENHTVNFSNSNESRERGVVYTIPVVFHIVHNYGLSNIDDSQIYDALNILNRDFRLQNADAGNVAPTFLGLPADCEIEFALATKKPNGQCFSGITRTVSEYTSGTENQRVSAVQNAHGNFPGDEYMNIFVIQDAGQPGAAGYTYRPNFFGDQMSAGIHISHTYVGSIGTGSQNLSRALTHEVGHWLNLSHPWGNTNDPGVSCGNDNVSDTPQTIGWTSCTLTGTTCDGQLDNVENYMEYSYCTKMFTPGQSTRMRAALNSSIAGRNNLWTASNLNNTGATNNNPICAANFNSFGNYTCVGGVIPFNDLSYSQPTNWTWNTPGGTPNNVNNQDPLVTYNTPGLHAVTLTAGDGVSTVNKTKNNYIHVFPTVAGAFPHSEDFEGYNTIPTAGIVAGYEDHPYSWAMYSGVTTSGNKAIRFNANACPYDNLEREFISYPIDLSGTTGLDVEITFKVAHKTRSSVSGAEKLILYYSDDCGLSWNIGRQWFHQVLSTGTWNSNYIPASATEYTVQNHTIPDIYKVSNFMYKFVWLNKGGGNIYIDDINIDYVPGQNVSIEEIAVEELTIFPNPFRDQITIQSTGKTIDDAIIEIFDSKGKLVQRMQNTITENFVINTNDFSEGFYILKIGNGTYSKSFKIVK